MGSRSSCFLLFLHFCTCLPSANHLYTAASAEHPRAGVGNISKRMLWKTDFSQLGVDQPQVGGGYRDRETCKVSTGLSLSLRAWFPASPQTQTLAGACVLCGAGVTSASLLCHPPTYLKSPFKLLLPLVVQGLRKKASVVFRADVVLFPQHCGPVVS